MVRQSSRRGYADGALEACLPVWALLFCRLALIALDAYLREAYRLSFAPRGSRASLPCVEHTTESGIWRQNWNGWSTITAHESLSGYLPRSSRPLAGLTFAVVGAGRLGTSLALALRNAGAELVGYTCRTFAGASRAANTLGIPGSTDIPALVSARALTADLYVLSVPDAELDGVAREMAEALSAAGSPADRHTRIAVMHTSGATSTAILAACADCGCLTLSFHPLQTFSDSATGADRFQGAAAAVTPGPGDDPEEAWRFGERIARAIGVAAFRLDEEHRVLYHTAATMASNYVVTLAGVAEKLLCAAGFPREAALPALLPLMRGAVDNLDNQGSVAALTGPLSRGDTGTIAAHLSALARDFPTLSTLYRELGLVTLDIVRDRHEIAPETIDGLAHQLVSDPAKRRQE